MNNFAVYIFGIYVAPNSNVCWCILIKKLIKILNDYHLKPKNLISNYCQPACIF